MTVIFNNIAKPAGEQQEDYTVHISLTWDSDATPLVREEGTDTTYYGTFTTMTDEDGRWEVDVVPNADLTPTSYYKIIEQEGSVVRSTYFVDVPSDGATPGSVWVGDILVATPEWEG